MTEHTPTQIGEIGSRFRRQILDSDTLGAISIVTTEFEVFAIFLAAAIPSSRSASLAFTALQEAKFWANDALAHE